MFARLVLDGSYKATLAVGSILAQQRQHRVKVFLTLLGGGSFGNKPPWIASAIQNALQHFKEQPLDVYLVHYGALQLEYANAISYNVDQEL